MAKLAHRWLAFLLTGTALSLAACLDDPAVRERAGVDENGRPLGSVSATPTASPSEGPTFFPLPQPSTSASAPARTPAPSASVAPSATPVAGAPGVSGRYHKTWDPLDLAIAGPGYLALSTRPDPRSLDDLLFTRFGQLELAFISSGSPAPGGVAAAGPGEWRLQTPDGLYVLGFNYEGEDTTPVPVEGQGTDYMSAFSLGGQLKAGVLALDSLRNPNFYPSFNFKGQLLSQNKPPAGADNEPRQIFVAVVQFDKPEALRTQAGLNTYRYTPDAGVVRVGVAGVRTPEAGLPRPVGDANLIRPETLEAP